jgi:hypothetical protein
MLPWKVIATPLLLGLALFLAHRGTPSRANNDENELSERLVFRKLNVEVILHRPDRQHVKLEASYATDGKELFILCDRRGEGGQNMVKATGILSVGDQLPDVEFTISHCVQAGLTMYRVKASPEVIDDLVSRENSFDRNKAPVTLTVKNCTLQ